jgi:hypothetical protein
LLATKDGFRYYDHRPSLRANPRLATIEAVTVGFVAGGVSAIFDPAPGHLLGENEPSQLLFFRKANPMHPTDFLPHAARAGSELRSTPTSPDAVNNMKLPPELEELINLFNRFRHERDSLRPEASRGLTIPRSEVLDQLSFSKLFHFTALWHTFRRLQSPAPHDAQHRDERLRERLWQGFYNWMLECLQERWAQQYGLVQAGGALSYRRLLGKQASKTGFVTPADYPPCHDHTTMWRRKGTPSRFAEVLVTQPYSYSLDQMVKFAQEQDLWFWISERPAWHYPRAVFFIEWANPESKFTLLRSAQRADDQMRTIHAWKGKELVPGPGTVFAVMGPTTITGWRDHPTSIH